MKKKVVAISLGVQLLACLLTGCATSDDNTTQVESVAFEPLPTVAEEIAPVPAAPLPVEEDTNTVTVHTEYGDIYFQEQWAEFMKTEQVMEDNVLTVSFMAEFNGKRYPLFTIFVGAGEGDPVTQITDADGVQRDVFVVFEELLEYDELASDEQNRLYAMQEEINFVIENLK